MRCSLSDANSVATPVAVFVALARFIKSLAKAGKAERVRQEPENLPRIVEILPLSGVTKETTK